MFSKLRVPLSFSSNTIKISSLSKTVFFFCRTVYEKDSPFQNIKIKHSNEFGNVLILDNDVSK